MIDIPLDRAEISYNPEDSEIGPPVRVYGGDVRDDGRYLSSWGISDPEFRGASGEDKLKMLLLEFIHLTLNEKLSPKDVHDGFMVIPEYRAALAGAAIINI